VGRSDVIAFLRRQWARKLDFRLIKEIWAFVGDRIAVRFAYEWHDDSNWFLSHGSENWHYNAMPMKIRVKPTAVKGRGRCRLS
jgi:nuclear transport factor 2 (NTF2) superfamily protein